MRWTIGNASPEGKDCLKLSVESFLALYGHRFEYFICHNNMDPQELDWTKAYQIQLFDQEKYCQELPIGPANQNPCWKLYPARLDLKRHEMMIDNDLIIYRHMPVIERFLTHHKYLFITEAIQRSYGRFNDIVPTTKNLNTGFVGLPPGFDLKAELAKAVKTLNLNWEHHLDEQALMAMIFCRYPHELVTLQDIAICHPLHSFYRGEFGQHFVQLNQGFTDYYRKFIAGKMMP